MHLIVHLLGIGLWEHFYDCKNKAEVYIYVSSYYCIFTIRWITVVNKIHTALGHWVTLEDGAKAHSNLRFFHY